ncbi:hypothetical protein K7432_014445 [Basidiobolus ranarum]|uniref:Uncharacterized protein n=1 Tax=Basidiobolus ranarum TaxID=34480 RepID=A0ABR2VPI4_9FUNG
MTSAHSAVSNQCRNVPFTTDSMDSSVPETKQILPETTVKTEKHIVQSLGDAF